MTDSDPKPDRIPLTWSTALIAAMFVCMVALCFFVIGAIGGERKEALMAAVCLMALITAARWLKVLVGIRLTEHIKEVVGGVVMMTLLIFIGWAVGEAMLACEFPAWSCWAAGVGVASCLPIHLLVKAGIYLRKRWDRV